MKNEWWKDFYSGVILEIQRKMKSDNETRTEAGCIEKVLQLQPGVKLLDVPCGNGRIALELASREYHLTGVDITEDFLEEAAAKTREYRLDIAWERRDMRDLPWHGHFDGAYCFGGSFGIFDETGNEDFLKAVARTLRPGAKFILDTHVAETLLPRFQKKEWNEIAEILVLQERRYDHHNSRVEFSWRLLHNERVEKRAGSIRVYSYRELCQLLMNAGFANCQGYGSLSLSPFRLGSPRLYLVAARA